MSSDKTGSEPGIGHHTRILFAEDDADVGFLVAEVLRAEGFDVTTVENGDQGAATFDSQPFHLLLTDVRMPGAKDGLDLAAHALAQNPNLPIVIVSGFAEELGTRLANLGRKATFLRKPFRVGELLFAVENALRTVYVSATILGLNMADDVYTMVWFALRA